MVTQWGSADTSYWLCWNAPVRDPYFYSSEECVSKRKQQGHQLLDSGRGEYLRG